MCNCSSLQGTRSLSIQGLSIPKVEHQTHDDENGSFVGSEDESDTIQSSLIEQLVNMNLGLEKQIEALTLRREFNSKHHEAAQESIKLSADSEMRSKDCTINALQNELVNKENYLSKLEEENEEKRIKLTQLQSQIDEMKQNIEFAASWVTEVQKEIVNMESENRQIESGETYEKTQRDIETLKKELYKFQQNIKVTSKELHHAREVIVTQGNSIKIIETEKFTMQAKFKEDLQRITMSMRNEIERLRDIMQNQWIEMKYLREQNQTVRQDVKDIRNLLSIAQPDSSRLNNKQSVFSSTSFPPSRRPTRGPPHPSLPSVSLKRTVPKGKKTILSNNAVSVIPKRTD